MEVSQETMLDSMSRTFPSRTSEEEWLPQTARMTPPKNQSVSSLKLSSYPACQSIFVLFTKKLLPFSKEKLFWFLSLPFFFVSSLSRAPTPLSVKDILPYLT